MADLNKIIEDQEIFVAGFDNKTYLYQELIDILSKENIIKEDNIKWQVHM